MAQDDDEGEDEEMREDGEQDKVSIDEEVERNTEANVELTTNEGGKVNGISSSAGR
jgi:hypothetical protein